MTGHLSITKLHISSSAQSTTLDFLLLLNLLLSWCRPSQQLSAPEHWGQECWSFLVALCPFSLTFRSISNSCWLWMHITYEILGFPLDHTRQGCTISSQLSVLACLYASNPFSKAASKLFILSKMWSPWPHPSAPNFQWPLFMFRMKLFLCCFQWPLLI